MNENTEQTTPSAFTPLVFETKTTTREQSVSTSHATIVDDGEIKIPNADTHDQDDTSQSGIAFNSNFYTILKIKFESGRRIFN